MGLRLGAAADVSRVGWVELDLGAPIEGFDDAMASYPSLGDLPRGLAMLYNGNAMGQAGFGWAELQR